MNRCRTLLKYRLRMADDNRHLVTLAFSIASSAGFPSLDPRAIVVLAFRSIVLEERNIMMNVQQMN